MIKWGKIVNKLQIIALICVFWRQLLYTVFV